MSLVLEAWGLDLKCDSEDNKDSRAGRLLYIKEIYAPLMDIFSFLIQKLPSNANVHYTNTSPHC